MTRPRNSWVGSASAQASRSVSAWVSPLPNKAASIGGYADGVIVGSAFIRRVLDAESSAEATAEVGRFAAELRQGVGRSAHPPEPRRMSTLQEQTILDIGA